VQFLTNKNIVGIAHATGIAHNIHILLKQNEVREGTDRPSIKSGTKFGTISKAAQMSIAHIKQHAHTMSQLRMKMVVFMVVPY